MNRDGVAAQSKDAVLDSPMHTEKTGNLGRFASPVLPQGFRNSNCTILGSDSVITSLFDVC